MTTPSYLKAESLIRELYELYVTANPSFSLNLCQLWNLAQHWKDDLTSIEKRIESIKNT